MSRVYSRECAVSGLDERVVQRIARKLSQAAREAQRHGLTIFGGSGSGSLRFAAADRDLNGPIIVAALDGPFDGGDGGEHECQAGLRRGET